MNAHYAAAGCPHLHPVPMYVPCADCHQEVLRQLANTKAQESALTALAQAERERDDLRELQNIPGEFQCLVCQYVLHARVIDAKTGEIGVSRVSAQHICPNDGLPMEQRSWKQEALELRAVFMEKCETIQTLTAQRQGLLTRIDDLKEYAVHDNSCILYFWEAGQPTSSGGYEEKYRGVWYESQPDNKLPPCECGLDALLTEVEQHGT